MKTLQDFWINKEVKNTVQEYLVNYLKEEAVRKLFDKEDVSAVAEAKEMIDKAFENLDVMFEPKPKEKVQVNEAR